MSRARDLRGVPGIDHELASGTVTPSPPRSRRRQVRVVQGK
ncbi:hypothetical protein [Nannocystis bainbridge]|uniref:Uncharacterized protein n=1 Tax=Nannocystis bainbridge TaxID=2995303 RepID=A0ABT5E9M6_9BACT|nr:hypothetical protein [Nannocystis bainbridge]MDC0722049.1 hypothetical protein [Nannocystis bainbridge]